jgi:hypothetical protein
LFLREFLPILDSLSPSPPLAPHLTPEARFVITGSEPATIERLSQMLEMRSQKLQYFKHNVSVAWDISTEKGNTLIFESESVTQFRSDSIKCGVGELNVWELERGEDGTLKLLS